MAERVHLHQRRHPRGVAEVVAVLALGEGRARSRLDAADRRVHVAGQLLAEEREAEPAEVGATPGAPDEQVGALPHLRQLEQCLLADDGLVQQHVVEHRAEGVADRGVGHRGGHGLGDRDAEAAGMVRILGQERATELGHLRRAGMHRRPPDLHHRLAIGLGPVGGRDLPHLALHAVLGTGEGEGAPPLPRPGLGGELLDALLVVVEGLRHRGVGLVRPGGADALVLVVDVRRRPERRLEPVGAVQRGRSVRFVGFAHVFWDFDVAFARHLLCDHPHRKQRRKIIRPDRLPGTGVERG